MNNGTFVTPSSFLNFRNYLIQTDIIYICYMISCTNCFVIYKAHAQ